MNYLVHAYLSGGSEEVMTGNKEACYTKAFDE